MKGRKGAVGRSLVTPALLHRRLDGGSGVLRLLLLSVVNKVTLVFPFLTFLSPSLSLIVFVYTILGFSAFFNLHCQTFINATPTPSFPFTVSVMLLRFCRRHLRTVLL